MLTQALHRPRISQHTLPHSTHKRSRLLVGQHRLLTHQAASSPSEALRVKGKPSPSEEQQEDIEYKDSWTDVQFINLCRTAYGNLAGWQSSRDRKDGVETYQGMLEVSRALMKVPRLSHTEKQKPHLRQLTFVAASVPLCVRCVLSLITSSQSPV